MRAKKEIKANSQVIDEELLREQSYISKEYFYSEKV